MTKQKRRFLEFYSIAWNSSIENWTAKQVKDNLWRFDAINDFDDMMQEARILFHKIEKKYPDVTEPAHFFTLYRTSLKRMFIDKSRKKRDSVETSPLDDLTEQELPQSHLQNLGDLALILEELPDELKTVLQALTTGRVRLKLDRHTKKLRLRENHNMRLKRQFSLTLADPTGALKAYLNP